MRLGRVSRLARNALHGTTIFLSAFLLFLLQPIIGKYILPWFGGTPAVWTTCLLFFQTFLLAGYLYAHVATTRLTPRSQALSHLLLMAAMALSLPIRPAESWKLHGSKDPTWHILGMLTCSIGIPFFLLSATAPLLQAWITRSRTNAVPYRFYALSNTGSLLALVTYPFLVEPVLPSSEQTRIWSWLGAGFALLCGACAVLAYRDGRGAESLYGAARHVAGSSITGTDRALWFGLSAAATTMLLATTNQMCQDVAVVPFLWIWPLALYLLSFVVCFGRENLYRRAVFGALWIAAAAQACVVLYRGVHLALSLQIASYSFTLLAGCMVCHGELVRRKPGASRLTLFYLMIAAGGVTGAIFVGLAAPHLFNGYWEFHLSLAGTSLLFLIVCYRDERSALFRGTPRWAWVLLACGFSGLNVALVIHARRSFENKIDMSRSFYGILRVREDDKEDPGKWRYTLMHGRIEHGFQFREIHKRYWPTSYFGANSGVGLAITFHPRRLAKGGPRNLRIGVAGLGTGTIAAYGEEGDYLRFYEINPDVLRFSERYFSYLRDTRARVDVVVGDARVSMEREMVAGMTQQFDVLAIDAFSSDAIPAHLLTEECFRVYWHHLKPDGILAVHVSSRYFELSPVARISALLSRGQFVAALRVMEDGNDAQGSDPNEWVLATSNRRFLESGAVQISSKAWPEGGLLWTDDYTNLFGALRRSQ